MRLDSNHIDRPRDWNWAVFAALTLFQLWAAHALVFFAHEYAHSFVAWMLGWKANPLALDYAHPRLAVFLIQSGINQKVDLVPIFASGHRVQAAIISAAGAVVGNALFTYSLSRWGYGAARKHDARGWAMFAYWVCVASVGNLIDYIPVRTFTDGTDLYQDTFAVERGLGWSPWTLLAVCGIPVAFALGYFFARTEPATLRWLFPSDRGKRLTIAILTAFVLFDFYGAAGWSEGGPVSHQMSMISVCFIAPVAAALSGYFVARADHRPQTN